MSIEQVGGGVPPMVEQASLIQSIAAEVIQIMAEANQDWDQLVCRAGAVVNASAFGVTRVVGGEEYPYRQSLLNRSERPHFHRIGAWYDRLREVMYRPGTGTWFGFTLTIRRPQSVDVAFDYDGLPALIQPVPSPQAFVWDFEKFPRDEAHTPGWLKAQLAEGNRLLNGGREQDLKRDRWKLYESIGQAGAIRPDDAIGWQAGPEAYALIQPSDVPYGIVISDGLSDPDPYGDAPDGHECERYLASGGLAGGVATGWLVDVLRGVCDQTVNHDEYGARFDVVCPTAPADWATNGVVTVVSGVGVPVVPESFMQPQGGLIRLLGLTLLRPAEVPLVPMHMAPYRCPFIEKLQALPPEQLTSLTRPSLV